MNQRRDLLDDSAVDTHADLSTVPRTLDILATPKPPCSSLDRTKRKRDRPKDLSLFLYLDNQDEPSNLEYTHL